MEKDQQLSHRSTLAWDEKSTPALGSAPVIYRDGAGGNYLESPEQLPSELDQLHALGDRKYGAGAAFRGTAPPQRKAKRADQRKNPERTSYRGRISAEQLVQEAGRARARPAPAEVSHAPSFVSRNISYVQQSTPV